MMLLRSSLLGAIVVAFAQSQPYEPTWESLDSRPIPEWYPDAKFGIFIHWGVFSVPSYGSEWFWNFWKGDSYPDYARYINRTEAPNFHYQEFASRFDAALYRPEEWAQIFAKSGAQYVVLTSKHHEGFTMWDSRDAVPATWNWNVMDIGPKRDVLGDLAKAVKNTTSPQTSERIKFGVYHSLFEFFNPAYLTDRDNNFTTQIFPKMKTIPELYDLVKKYEPELVWSDGDWGAQSDYWMSKEFLAWYANESPVKDTAVWNDRWGQDAMCKHGSYLTCSDRFQPDKMPDHIWENCFTIDASSWGYSRNSTYESYYSTKSLLDVLISTVALNGNLLLNVGPASDGTIHPIFVDRLVGMGEWLKVNGAAIYGTKPWVVVQNETAANVYYTRTDESLFAITTQWPSGNQLALKYPKTSSGTIVKMLGVEEELDWWIENGKVQIKVPALTPDIIPCQHAWVFSMTGVTNLEEEEEKDYFLRMER